MARGQIDGREGVTACKRPTANLDDALGQLDGHELISVIEGIFWNYGDAVRDHHAPQRVDGRLRDKWIALGRCLLEHTP